jgi:hypothetical protein
MDGGAPAVGREDGKMDTLMDQNAAVQLANAEGLRELRATVMAFIDSLRRGGNGRG